jgi:hypothetical protein
MVLRCTGQMLYKRLFLAFGYLHQKNGVRKYEKDYEVICAAWLGQPARRYRADITRHLGKHLDDLVTVGLLKSYEIAPKAKGDGFKLVFFAGSGFYEDYSLYLETAAAQLPMRAPDIADDEPAKLVGCFHLQLGRTHGEFRRQELEQARELLKAYTLTEAEDLVDYALAERAKNVVPQVFGFVLGYVPQWLPLKAKRLKDRKWRRLTAACTLCDAAGFLRFIPGGAQSKPEVRIQACPHDREKVERWAREHGHIVQPPETPLKP